MNVVELLVQMQAILGEDALLKMQLQGPPTYQSPGRLCFTIDTTHVACDYQVWASAVADEPEYLFDTLLCCARTIKQMLDNSARVSKGGER
jgi:hypothetical protein